MSHAKLVSLVALLLVAACTKDAKDGEASGSPASPTLVEVKLDSLVSAKVEDAIPATGRTDVLKRETVASPVVGKLITMKVAEGEAVKAGQVVASVRTKESQSALEGAEVNLREARTPVEKLEAQRVFDLAQATQSLIPLRTKSGGTVATRLVQEGEQVTENESLVTILDLSTLDFRAEVPLSSIGNLRVGEAATVTLQALPDLEFPAQVEVILPQVQSQSQTLSIRLRFNDGSGESARNRLKADMAGDARIFIASRPNALLAPKTALLRNDETGTYSLVAVGNDSLAHVLPVKTGAIKGDRQEVSGEGLRPGLKIIVQGQYGLADSTRIRPVR